MPKSFARRLTPTPAEARRAQARRSERPDATPFQSTPGEVEVLIDAGKVNTRGGWRDVKMGVFLKRQLGAPASPDEWASRTLPAPSVRAVVAAVEGVERFGPRLRAESDRLGVTAHPAVTVLADGGEWIWAVASEHWPQAAGVLDVFHALEAVSEAVKTAWGPNEAATGERIASGRMASVRGGNWGSSVGSANSSRSCRTGAMGRRCGRWRRTWPSTRPD